MLVNLNTGGDRTAFLKIKFLSKSKVLSLYCM